MLDQIVEISEQINGELENKFYMAPTENSVNLIEDAAGLITNLHGSALSTFVEMNEREYKVSFKNAIFNKSVPVKIFRCLLQTTNFFHLRRI